MRKVVSFLAGFFVGGLVGAGAGLILAPLSGTDLQNRVRARLDELMEEGRQAAADRRAELEDQLEAFKTGESLTMESASGRG